MSKVVIGHRMGKGDNVKTGLENTGHEVVLIPGMLADMKLGDVMVSEKADFGISFCGSGGAGALNAGNKHGFKNTHGLRTVDQGVQAIKNGFIVIGFGFMDSVDLGEAIGNAINEIKK